MVELCANYAAYLRVMRRVFANYAAMCYIFFLPKIKSLLN